MADKKNFTEIGTIPVYKAGPNFLAIKNFICDLTSKNDEVLGDLCSGLNGDIIVSLGKGEKRQTYVVKSSDLIDFINKQD